MSAASLYQPHLLARSRASRRRRPTRRPTSWRPTASAGAGDYQPGQFVELSVFGVGEAPFCLAQSPTRSDFIEVTIRRTGAVTDRLHTYRPGRRRRRCEARSATAFPFERARGKNLIFVGGGIGLPPLRSLINYVLDHRGDYGDVHVLYGARTPADRVYKRELAELEPLAGPDPGRDRGPRRRYVDTATWGW